MYTRQSSEALDHTPVGFSTPRHKARPLDASSLRLSICPPDSGSCLPSPSRATIALNTPTTVSFLALPLTLSPARKRDKCLLSVKATTPTFHRTSYCEKMLQLNLARDEYAQRAAPKSAFGPSYSPAHSECSSSSKSAHSRSPSPPVRRMPQFNNVSHTRTFSLTHHTLPRSRTHPSDLSSAAGASVSRRPSRSGNEEVLRSRLEGVLSSASSTRDISCPPSPQRRRAATTGESSYGLITPPHGTLPVPPMTRSRTSPAMTRPSPLTPPPSPPFDANRVALQLRDREGYVSFAEVDGLGMPSDDQDTCDAERGRGRWWLMWKG